MVIVRGPDSYITPSWYASKAEHGRVVPHLELHDRTCVRHPDRAR
ncbi:FMN-binding negative transcriptional regulator [Amycolatopsis sp. YIM 10]